jgi:hypothetical protein
MKGVDYRDHSTSQGREPLHLFNINPCANSSMEASWSLPQSEIRRLLTKCRSHEQARGSAGRFLPADGITVSDVARECGIPCRSRLHRLLRGERKCDLGPVPLRRLARFLTRMEHGLVVKRDGKIVYLSEPTRKPDHVFGFVLTSAGPRIVWRAQTLAPQSPPSIFVDFKMPKR